MKARSLVPAMKNHLPLTENRLPLTTPGQEPSAAGLCDQRRPIGRRGDLFQADAPPLALLGP
jgi:hypothetical protein